ncbi:hypothetical protein E2P81_ATG01628 [Venturia nashicola]|nr:hypothetical protein E2P81_ATG01628 [Venturia nashicola]
MADLDEPPSFSDEIRSQLVTIEVGEEKQLFSVHQDLLTASSKFFKAAFEGEFREATIKTIPLVDTAPQQVQDFLDWLYFRRLPAETERDEQMKCRFCGSDCPTRSQSSNQGKDDDLLQAYPQFLSLSADQEEALDKLFQREPLPLLYVFADRYDIPALRRKIVDKLWYCFEESNTLPSFLSIAGVGSLLPTTSPLLRLWIDLYIDGYCMEDDASTTCSLELAARQKLPFEFIYAVMGGLSNQKFEEPRQGMKKLCAYHEHPQDETTITACTDEITKKRKKTRDYLNKEEISERHIKAKLK